MSKTIIEEESCLNSFSFISSSNVLKMVAMLVMTLLLSSLINIQTVSAQIFSYSILGQPALSYPARLTVDNDGNIYVTQTYLNYVVKLSPTGDELLRIGTSGLGDGQFNTPRGVAVDSIGNIYVADANNYRVQKFTSSGDFILKFGSYGFGDGQFYIPYGVAVDSAGKIYVTDVYNNRIQVFNSSGGFLFKFGSSFNNPGSGDGQFNYPRGIAVDSTGNIYVADTNNNRIQVFDSSGYFLLKFGSYGTGDGQFNYLSEVAVDNAGNIYVVDGGNNRIQVFDSSGNFLLKFGSYGTGDGQFNGPSGVALDSIGNIYVADNGNSRIQVFFFYSFIGFYPPVDNPPTVNVAKAGSAIPVKFSLDGYYGMDILEVGYPKSQKIVCDSSDPLDMVEETVSAGSSSLSYDAGTDEYIYVWKTNKGWANTCRQLIVKLNDGTEHIAHFEFK